MPLSITLSFIGEGTTDDRFIPNISERLIKQLLIEQNREATIIEWKSIYKTGENFVEIMLNAAIEAKSSTTLIVHCDADNTTAHNVIQTKIQPGIDAIANYKDECCRSITVVIPISETEAWMLVDKDLLKEEMNTALSNHDLGLTYQLNKIEKIAKPKRKIEDAIDFHHQSLSRKRRKSAVTIGELYEPISQQIELEKLEVLESFKSFKENLINALKGEHILN